jgi:Flp pilus assembly protein TadG
MPTKTETHQRKTEPARGQSLIEFVLVLPALLILLLGLIELALVLRAQLVLTNANREAARYASHGAFTDEQVAERATIAFSQQLPLELSGPDANVGIIITRFHIPSGDAEATYDPPYITGTLTYTASSGEVRATPSKLELDTYAQTLKEQNASYFTTNDVVIVETYYHHSQILNAPLIEWFFPEPMVLYMRTAMRISRPRIEPETQE